MPALDTRQRTKINSVLVALHQAGFNADAISAAAQKSPRWRHDQATAYDEAVTAALVSRPDMMPALRRIAAQVDASDDATVAFYDCRLREYIATGDPTKLAQVERVAVRDMVELGVQNGELQATDVAAGRIDWGAIGLDGEGAGAAYAAPVEAPAAPVQARSSFAFADPAAIPTRPGDPAAWSPTGGYSSRRASSEWQNALVVTDGRPPLTTSPGSPE